MSGFVEKRNKKTVSLLIFTKSTQKKLKLELDSPDLLKADFCPRQAKGHRTRQMTRRLKLL